MNLLECQAVARGPVSASPSPTTQQVNQLGVVQNAAVGVADAVAQFAPFVDGPGGFGGDVAADVAGEGKLLEEALHPFVVFALIGIDLAVGAFQIDRAEHTGCTMAGASHEDHVQVVLFNQAVAVDVGEAEGRGSAPVAQQAMFHMLGLQGFFQQWIIPQVNHADGEVVTGPPVGMNFAQFFVGQGLGLGRRCDNHTHGFKESKKAHSSYPNPFLMLDTSVGFQSIAL
jgi:hypothetical protein